MADYMAAEIWIGGLVPKNTVRRLCVVIGSEETALDWGDAHFQPTKRQDLLDAVRDVAGVPLHWLGYERVRYGQFSELELFLEQHRIPFDRASEGTCEYDPDFVQYRPGMSCPRTFITNRSRQPVVERREVQAILAMFERGRTRMVLTALQKLVGKDVPPLPPFAIH